MYVVPAYIGVRVKVSGKPGVLVAARSDLHYLHVLFDGASKSAQAHPTSEVEYFVFGSWLAKNERSTS